MTSDLLLEKRNEIIALHNKNTPVREIVRATGVSRPAVDKAIKLYKAGGMEALQPQTGRTQGSGRALSPEQEAKIKRILYTKQPREVRIISIEGKYSTAPKEEDLEKEISKYSSLYEIKLNGDYPQYLWCRDSVKELIKQISGIDLSTQAINKYLRRWGFPKVKHNERPISRCSKAIQRWIEGNPLTEDCTKIYWLYKERLNTNTKQSKVSATDSHRKEFWTVIEGNFSQEKQIEFLQQLRGQSRHRMTLVRNDYDQYTKKLVRKWVSKTDITILPPLLESEKKRLFNDRVRKAEVRRELDQEYFDKNYPGTKVKVFVTISDPDDPTATSDPSQEPENPKN